MRFVGGASSRTGRDKGTGANASEALNCGRRRGGAGQYRCPSPILSSGRQAVQIQKVDNGGGPTGVFVSILYVHP